MRFIRSVGALLLAASAAEAFVAPAPHKQAAAARTTTSLHEGKGPFAMLGGIGDTLSKEFGSLLKAKGDSPKQEVEKEKPQLPDVVIDPDYTLGVIFLVGGILLDLIPYIQLTLGPIVTLLGILFVVQATRVRFCFDDTSFELRTSSGEDGNLDRTGENIVVGGENRWPYEAFVNYEFFPEGWIDQPQGPILVYFKETQTSSDKWNEGPGKSANSPEALANGAKPGQVHFFPTLCNAKQLRAEFERRGCAKL